MTLEELKSLQPGDVVVITKVDNNISHGNGIIPDYYVGEEMTFFDWGDWVDFIRSNVDYQSIVHNLD